MDTKSIEESANASTNNAPKKTKRKSVRTKRPKQNWPMVEVWWDDASGLRHGWEDSLDNVQPQMVLSVGFLLKETDEHIIIAQDIDADGMHNGRSQIPVGMVKYMKILKKADA